MDSLFADGLRQACPERTLSCYSGEATKAALPVLAVAAVATAVIGAASKWRSNLNWQKDIREHCQQLQSSQAIFTGLVLSVSAIGAVAAVISGVATSPVLVSVLAGSTVVLLATNHLVHNNLINQHKPQNWK